MHRRQALRLRRTVARLRSLTAVPRQEFRINAVVADSSPALAEVVFTSGGTVRNVQFEFSQIMLLTYWSSVRILVSLMPWSVPDHSLATFTMLGNLACKTSPVGGVASAAKTDPTRALALRRASSSKCAYRIVVCT